MPPPASPSIAPIGISRLRHEVILVQRENVQADTFGQTAGSYKPFAITRAQVRPAGAGEIERAHSFGSKTNFVVEIRWRRGVTVAMQVRFRGRTFLINGIINLEERKILLQLYCEELG